jgi:hypothetical protein
MFAYGIGLLPLIRAQVQFPEMDQTWYADDAGAGGKFDAIKRHLKTRRNRTQLRLFPRAFEAS